jgi:signal transduction histidine kinase/ActR/RegA family two-component response regulator
LLVARCEAESFSSGECEFLTHLGEHVALAAHQVELYTALQRAYDELRQSQQAVLQQERLRALGQMASGIAHDINNAISPVALYTESLLEREPNLSQRARGYLVTIQRAIDDVAQTVARMREFYRRDQQSELMPIELHPLISQVLELTRARWSDIPQERGCVVEVRTELTAATSRITGVESDIRDALTNLIFNAVDAMPNGGVLTFRTRLSSESQPHPGDVATLELEVSDTGIGMDEDTRRRCLEPFFTTKGERGTGMGLAMVYGMVRRHDAAIEIASAVGEGTTIKLEFNCAPTHDDVSIVIKGTMVVGALHVLIVDDDPLLSETLSEILSADGHTVVAADGGQAGIETFERLIDQAPKLDVVITDLGMPYIDGRAVAAAVKRRSPTTPVIMLTGWGQQLSMESSMPANVDILLSKPPKMRELRRALADLLTRVGDAESRGLRVNS